MNRQAQAVVAVLRALALVLPLAALAVTDDYDPLARALADQSVANREAVVPPQCYTKTGSRSNPCWACHVGRNGRNAMDDWTLQQQYAFSEVGQKNHWTNLFKDRRAEIAAISDEAALAYIREDNYVALRANLATRENYLGWRPDLDYLRGFDEQGFARDGSGWRAFRYKPFLGTFWPTNGSTDDVIIRLPEAFRRDASGQPSVAVYKANLAIVEAAIAVADTIPAARLRREIEPIDEAAVGIDLDGDGRLAVATVLRGLPLHYAGAAADVKVVRYEYPTGTEFLHSVRYVDPDAPNLLSARLKELRYAIKRHGLPDGILARRYVAERREKLAGALPAPGGNANTGLSNSFGWQLQGFIEDAQGRLRVQTRHEQLFCMGCHSTIGVTVDQTFALARKLPGVSGWGWQNLAGITDVPQAGARQPEILTYLERVGAGDEFRANTEMLERFFPKGRLDRKTVLRAAPGGDGDLRNLIVPSRGRALALAKAYMRVVAEQSFTEGRDAVLAPAINVNTEIANTPTALKASGRVYRDGRLWLDWPAAQVAP